MLAGVGVEGACVDEGLGCCRGGHGWYQCGNLVFNCSSCWLFTIIQELWVGTMWQGHKVIVDGYSRAIYGSLMKTTSYHTQTSACSAPLCTRMIVQYDETMRRLRRQYWSDHGADLALSDEDLPNQVQNVDRVRNRITITLSWTVRIFKDAASEVYHLHATRLKCSRLKYSYSACNLLRSSSRTQYSGIRHRRFNPNPSP